MTFETLNCMVKHEPALLNIDAVLKGSGRKPSSLMTRR